MVIIVPVSDLFFVEPLRAGFVFPYLLHRSFYPFFLYLLHDTLREGSHV